MSENKWFPELMYEEAEDGLSSKIPFIMVPQEEVMPKVLFVFESRETGEFEPGPNGEKLPILEMDLHQYADMVHLKEGLTPALYDEVRICLGLEPLQEAVEKGRQITDNIRKNISETNS